MVRQAIYILLFSFVFSGCGLNFKRGNGRIESREYDLSDFDKIYVGGNYNLTLIPSDKNQAVIETDENLFRHINIEVFDRSLNINNVHNLKGSRGIRIDIFYKNLNHIYSTGASKINHQGILNTDNLKIDLSGAGSIEVEMETDLVEVQMSGAGVLTLSGYTRQSEVHISGAGGLRGENLRSEECKVNLSGIGNANVFVTKKLIATITGIGGIRYSGNPDFIEKRVTGLGKIESSGAPVEYEDESL